MNTNFKFNWQTFEHSFSVAKRLLVKAGAHTDTGRINTIILNNMQIYISSFTFDTSSTDTNAIVNFNGYENTTFGNFNGSVTLSVPATSQDFSNALRSGILNWINTNFSLSLADSNLSFASSGGFLPNPRLFSNSPLAVNTSRQPSTTRDTMVNASVDITSTISLTTGQTGKVTLQYADNTGFSTNVVTVQSATNGNTGSLTIGLNLSQVYTAALSGIVPAGKFYRLVTTNVTGTPTYGTPVIQEVLL